ncbi:thermostable hemolysin [Haliea sp. E17]|uniref:thermostable hemolysin n=1 Tax=Haliea sp. E17 TaxID=3401576 RepID=UPI003AAC2C9A
MSLTESGFACVDHIPPFTQATRRPRARRQPHLAALTAGSAGRARAERFIGDNFQASYGARLTHFMPIICSLQQEDAIKAALGLRAARCTSLFVEQYLQQPAEVVIGQHYPGPVSRSSVWEMGNLAASDGRVAVMLYLLVTAALHRLGVDYLVFAANAAVRQSIRRRGFTTRTVCNADPLRLGSAASDWGSYYDSDPQVLVASIPEALDHGQTEDWVRDLWAGEEAQIARLAVQLSRFDR